MKKLFLFNILACLFALQGLALEVGQTFTYKDENGTTWGCEVINYTTREVSITSASGYGNEVVIPDVVKNGEDEYKVTELGEELFIGNKEITKVTLPKGLEMLNRRAFSGCENLSAVENLASVTSVSEQAFYQCSSLSHVDLPSCTQIGWWAFSSCPNIRVSLGASCPKLGYGAFDSTATVTAPLSRAALYRYSADWKKYFGQITFIDDIMKISTKALSDKSGIENVIGATEVSKVTALKVTGTINSYDIFIIRTKMYDLHYLDLTDADIVACDFPYYES